MDPNKYYKEILLNKTRQEILKLVENEPIQQNEIIEKLKISRGSVQHHLKVLQDWNLILITKDKKSPGQPSAITLNKERLVELRNDYSSHLFGSLNTGDFTKKVLKFIQEENHKGKAVTNQDLLIKFGLESMADMQKTIPFLDIQGFIGYAVTKQGEVFLKGDEASTSS